MGRVVLAEEATIKSASVAIRTIVVEKRQMTLSVFRQIPEESVFSYWKTADGHPLVKLNGTLWGHVNYWWDSAPQYTADGKAAMHLLWQNGNELRRCRPVRPSRDNVTRLEKELAFLRDDLIRKPIWGDYSNSPLAWVSKVGPNGRITDRLSCIANVSVDEVARWEREDIRPFHEAFSSNITANLWDAELLDKKATLFEQLDALEQLFIAT